MLKLSDDQIAEIQESAQQQLKHQQDMMRQHVEAFGGELKAEAAETIAVSGPASFALGFIIGNLRFTPDRPDLGLSLFVPQLWGVGLSGGLSYVAGSIERPSSGLEWTVTVQNTPGIATGCSIQFFENGRPVGIVAGPGLSGGLGLIAGGNGKWG